MIFQKKVIACGFLLFLGTLTNSVVAQEATLQGATDLFEKGCFHESASAFSKLIQKSERDVRLNFLYGASLTESNQNIAEAVKRLKFAQINGGGVNVMFYQGRAAQLNYEFELAMDFYSKFLKTGKDKVLLSRATTYLTQCQASVHLSAKIFEIKVMGSKKTNLDNLLSLYHPSKDVGSLMPNSSFFDTGVTPNELLFRTERGDQVYYSSASVTGTQDLYKMEKLIDGWSNPQAINELNSDKNNRTPFLMVDGLTLYFASDREGGMGGLDIYKASYDAEKRQFSEPINLGVPFNSPFDDYLFVADEFKGSAWFASNRNTQTDSIEVFQILWDGSVIRNFAYDKEEIRAAARLTPSPDLASHPANDSHAFTSDKRIAHKAELFRFVINDTLTYTDWDHFRNQQAREEYEKGFELFLKKDSLNSQMAELRKTFASTSSEEKRNQTVNNILKMENEVYGIDNKIENHQLRARMLETTYLKENKGSLVPITSKVTNREQTTENIDKILIPKNFSYYTDEEFERQLNEWNLMYVRLFDQQDVEELHKADSLYVWGNILTLEASRQNEQLLKWGGAAGNTNLIQRSDTQEQIDNLKENAKKYKALSLNLYHQALNSKYRLFTDKINEIKLNDQLAPSAMFELQRQASDYLKKANELAPVINNNDFEPFEKAGTYKRQAVALQTDALFDYLLQLDAPAQQTKQPATKANEPEKPKQTQAPKETPKASQTANTTQQQSKQASANKESGKPEYRIQLGLFRNRPNEAMLSQLQHITTVKMENGASKYYCGAYSSYSEAASNVTKVREAGFEGAFVVAFLGDEQISVTKAKELE